MLNYKILIIKFALVKETFKFFLFKSIIVKRNIKTNLSKLCQQTLVLKKA